MDQPIARPIAFDRRSAPARAPAPSEAPGSDPGTESAPYPASSAASSAVSATSLGRVSSEELLAGARELEIVHGDALYRLRLTALGKLILTK